MNIDIVRKWLSFGPPAPSFVTFWHGPLDPIIYTCLSSFPHHGAGLRLYSYDRHLDVPVGVELADAREIVRERHLIDRFTVSGNVSISKFSDYFRYRAIRATGSCWVDADIVCLRPDFGRDRFIFGYQGKKTDGPWALNGAVLRLPRRHPMLDELLYKTIAAMDIDGKWGVVGPLLITEMATKHGLMYKARPTSTFYPIAFPGFWKMLMPERKSEVERASAGSTFIHLWNERYRQAGYDKTIAPPEGSFLHGLCVELGTLGRFSRIYGRDELRHTLSSYVKD